MKTAGVIIALAVGILYAAAIREVPLFAFAYLGAGIAWLATRRRVRYVAEVWRGHCDELAERVRDLEAQLSRRPFYAVADDPESDSDELDDTDPIPVTDIRSRMLSDPRSGARDLWER
jgi:hypothetical protein